MKQGSCGARQDGCLDKDKTPSSTFSLLATLQILCLTSLWKVLTSKCKRAVQHDFLGWSFGFSDFGYVDDYIVTKYYPAFSALFRLLNYFDILIAVDLHISSSVLGTEFSFLSPDIHVGQSIRHKANEGTESWPQARRNGTVWASDLFRPGVCFQPRHLRNVWNWIPYKLCEPQISSCVKWVFEKVYLGTENNAWPVAWPVLRFSRMPVLTLINLSPNLFIPLHCDSISAQEMSKE